MKISCTYQGDGQTELRHEGTQKTITTDLPHDNGGKGRDFSPTDLFVSALGSCILTIMGKVAENNNVDLKGTHIDMEKFMSDSPRRIGKIVLNINFPAELDDQMKSKLLKSVHACPVHRSLHPEIEIIVQSN